MLRAVLCMTFVHRDEHTMLPVLKLVCRLGLDFVYAFLLV